MERVSEERLQLEKVRNKSLDIDICIIMISTAIVFVILANMQVWLYDLIRDSNISIILRTAIAGLAQYGVAGLGITIVMLYRKEGLGFYGLRIPKIVRTLLMSALIFLPYVAYIVLSGQYTGYNPLSVMVTEYLVDSVFFARSIGMIIVALSWGFFEGFNYVVLSKKINERYPSKYRLLNWGGVFCSLMCIIVHGLIGVTADALIELVCIVIIIYGMILIRDFTKNSWGIIMIFLLLWNAF